MVKNFFVLAFLVIGLFDPSGKGHHVFSVAVPLLPFADWLSVPLPHSFSSETPRRSAENPFWILASHSLSCGGAFFLPNSGPVFSSLIEQ